MILLQFIKIGVKIILKILIEFLFEIKLYQVAYLMFNNLNLIIMLTLKNYFLLKGTIIQVNIKRGVFYERLYG